MSLGWILSLTTPFSSFAVAQNILLYQRLTKVMAKLTYGVEVEMQEHMENLELRLQKAGDAAQGLGPELERLRATLADIENYVIHDLEHSIKKSRKSVHDGLQGATHLQRLLTVMIQTVLDGASQVAVAQEKSLDLAGQRDDEIRTWINAIATVAASTDILNSRIVRTCLSGSGMIDHGLQTDVLAMTGSILHPSRGLDETAGSTFDGAGSIGYED